MRHPALSHLKEVGTGGASVPGLPSSPPPIPYEAVTGASMSTAPKEQARVLADPVCSLLIGRAWTVVPQALGWGKSVGSWQLPPEHCQQAVRTLDSRMTVCTFILLKHFLEVLPL